MKLKVPGLLCLEGEWDEDNPTSRMSVEPTLRLLEKANYFDVVHRDVCTEQEFWRHLDRWAYHKAFKDYKTLYLGFHGSPHRFYIGELPIGLEQLSQRLEGQCADSLIYFASCGVLGADESTLKTFCKQTGAKAVMGYTEEVDWLESAAFELINLGTIANTASAKIAYKAVMKGYGELATRLGFRVATATWASDWG